MVRWLSCGFGAWLSSNHYFLDRPGIRQFNLNTVFSTRWDSKCNLPNSEDNKNAFVCRKGWIYKKFCVTLYDFLPLIKRVSQFLIKEELFLIWTYFDKQELNFYFFPILKNHPPFLLYLSPYCNPLTYGLGLQTGGHGRANRREKQNTKLQLVKPGAQLPIWLGFLKCGGQCTEGLHMVLA